MASDRVVTEPSVVEALGKPINAGFADEGNFHNIMIGGDPLYRGPDCIQAVAFPIHGPKGRAVVCASAFRHNGNWTLTSLAAIPDVTGNAIWIVPGPATGGVQEWTFTQPPMEGQDE